MSGGGEGGELAPLPSGADRKALLAAARALRPTPDTSNSTSMPDPHKHGRMTAEEALGVITAIAKYYPYWLSGQDEEAVEGTLRAWAGELIDLGEMEEVWEEVRDCLRKYGGPFPPSIFEIRRHAAANLHHRRMVYRSPPKMIRTAEEEAFSEKCRDDHLILINEVLNGKHRNLLAGGEESDGKQNS